MIFFDFFYIRLSWSCHLYLRFDRLTWVGSSFSRVTFFKKFNSFYVPSFNIRFFLNWALQCFLVCHLLVYLIHMIQIIEFGWLTYFVEYYFILFLIDCFFNFIILCWVCFKLNFDFFYLFFIGLFRSHDLTCIFDILT